MSQRIKKSIVARCAECDSRIFFPKMPDLGHIVTCRECGTRLEVIYLDPIELDWADDDAYVDQIYDDYEAYDDNAY